MLKGRKPQFEGPNSESLEKKVIMFSWGIVVVGRYRGNGLWSALGAVGWAQESYDGAPLDLISPPSR